MQKNLRHVGEEFETAQKLRSKIVEKYKESELDNGKVKIKENKLDQFKQDIDELLNQHVEVQLQLISLDELEGIKVAPSVLSKAHKILKG